MGRFAPQPPLPGGTGQLGQVTLGGFLDELPAGIQVLSDEATAAAARGAAVRWVEPSELEDPTPYLLEGELVLTAGLPFLGPGGTAAALEDYVARLVRAKVCALGFGIQPYFDEVPGELVRACRQQQLMLLQIPQSVPFAALGLHFARLLEAQNLQALRRLSEATGQLLKAVLSARPDAQVLETLARHAPVRALLAGADGRIRAQAGHAPDPDRVAALLGRLFAGSGPRIEVDSFAEPGFGTVTGYPLRSTRDANIGAVLVGADGTLGPVERNIVETAVGLLEALLRQRTSGALAPGQLATGLLLHPETALSGASRQAGAGQDLLAQCTSSARSGTLRVVQGIPAATGAAGRRGAGEGPMRELLQWRRLFDTKLVELTDYGFCAITRLRVDGAATAEAERLGWLLAVSEPAEPSDLPAAYRQVTSLRRQLQTSGRSVRADQTSWSVAGLLGPEAGSMLARQLLGPLLDLEPAKSHGLLRVLRGWLAENGSWDASAKALGLHRNSVRRQIGQVGELLAVDLADAATRAELLIALRFVDPQPAGVSAAAAPHEG
ncbi:PucR family transcriptional regulator [Arthrobacter mobilis]|uniref:PucR family transcriptional regulator n=1 Tax=Arthrobacter mobilis TaxID=2724944 RepID=A0A7X6HDS8_9MICC|nr:PucR family transcriptional regulator [Arthrobacter mobilis]NKX55156.1 PucR family transcriptional regulator [Arthrobacter mobilis]